MQSLKYNYLVSEGTLTTADIHGSKWLNVEQQQFSVITQQCLHIGCQNTTVNSETDQNSSFYCLSMIA